MGFNVFLRQGHIVSLTKLFLNKCSGSSVTTGNIVCIRQGSTSRLSSCSSNSKISLLQQYETYTRSQINYKQSMTITASCQRTLTELRRLYSTRNNSSFSYLNYLTRVCKANTLPTTNNRPRHNINYSINIGPSFTYKPKYKKSNFSKQHSHHIGIGLYNASVDSLSTNQIFQGQLRCMTQGNLEPQNQTKIQSEKKGVVINGSSKITEGVEKKDGITPSNDPPETPKKLSLYQRFKQTYKEHGKILIGVHLVTSAAWFGSFYVAARSGLDIVPYLENWNVSEKVISPFRSGGLGFVAVAYLLYKLATPARYAVTIGGTNLVIRYLRKEGKLKQIPKEDSLRSLYKEGKEDLKRKSKVRMKRLRRKGKMNGKGPQNDK